MCVCVCIVVVVVVSAIFVPFLNLNIFQLFGGFSLVVVFVS